MKLAAVMKNLEYQLLRGTEDKDAKALIYFSDKAEPGSMFFAIPGTERDGTEYIRDAVSHGADIIVVRRDTDLPESLPASVTVLAVDDVRRALARASLNFYRDPCRHLLTVAVTGTKGKTSTTFMIREILEAAGIRTGLLGTVQNGWEGCFEEADRTTPQSADIQHWARRMADAGCKALVIEVSSQGMKQYRVEGILFDIAVFTNLSPDHIGPGEHENFEEYAFWKSRLAGQCRLAVFNDDDPHWHALLPEYSCRRKTFGQSDTADYVCEHLRLKKWEAGPGVEFMMKGYQIRLNLPGRFNGINAAGAIAAVRELGVSWDKITETLAVLKIPGRAEPVETGGRTSILVDYAHNGLALRQLMTDLRQYEPERLIAVFGCGGGRDRNRRFEMGRAAAELADYTVVTSDNPRREHPMSIVEDIVCGMKAAGVEEENYIVIPDRKEAIVYAASLGRPEDIVLIAGKGHETWQYTGDEKIHFDDREVVKDAVKGSL